MKLKKICWMAYLPLICYSISVYNEIDLVESFAKYITNYAMIITKAPEKISSSKPLSIIVQEFVENFPTAILSYQALLTLPDKKNVEDITTYFAFEFQRSVLKIIFLDATDKNATHELIDTVNLLANFTINSPPSKCAIILINSDRNNVDFQQFFRFSWENKLLYLTVVEYLQKQKSKNRLLSYKNYSTPIIHQYNPYNNSYKHEFLAAKVDLFSDNLSDLYGFPLNVEILEDSPNVMVDENYNGDNVLDAIYGIDVEISRALAKKLNFSFNVKAILSNNKHLTRFNTTMMGFIYEGINNDILDYSLNLAANIGRPSMRGYEDNIQLGTFLYKVSPSILAKQYGSYKVNMLSHIISSIVLTITCILVFVSVLKFDKKVWTFYNITKILIGISINPEPQKIGERILFLSLTFIYVVFSVNIMENLLSVLFYQKTYIQLETLNDTINAGIVPSMVNQTKQILLNHATSDSESDSVLRILAQNSKTLGSFSCVKNCLISLLNDNVRSVNGCEVINLMGELVEKNFVGNKDIRLITLVEQPIFSGWGSMLHSPKSPYIGRFDSIMRTLFEAGLMDLWIQDYTRDFFTLLREELTSTSSEDQEDNEDAVDEQAWSTKKIAFQLLIWYLICMIIFLCEIAWSRFKTDIIMQKRAHKPVGRPRNDKGKTKSRRLLTYTKRFFTIGVERIIRVLSKK